MKHLYFLILLILPILVIAKDPYPKNPNIDIINYIFELHFNDTNDIIQGNADINLHIKPTEENVILGSGIFFMKIPAMTAPHKEPKL